MNSSRTPESPAMAHGSIPCNIMALMHADDYGGIQVHDIVHIGATGTGYEEFANTDGPVVSIRERAHGSVMVEIDTPAGRYLTTGYNVWMWVSLPLGSRAAGGAS